MIELQLTVEGAPSEVNELPKIAVRYVETDELIADARFMVVLFGNKRYLFDRLKGSTKVVDLMTNQPSGHIRLTIVESAQSAAAEAGLLAVYFIRRPHDSVDETNA